MGLRVNTMIAHNVIECELTSNPFERMMRNTYSKTKYNFFSE